MTRGATGFVAIENDMNDSMTLGSLVARSVEHLNTWLSYYPSMAVDSQFLVDETSRQAARLVQNHIRIKLLNELNRRRENGQETPPTSSQNPKEENKT